MEASSEDQNLLKLYRISDRKFLRTQLLSSKAFREPFEALFVKATLQAVETATKLERSCNFDLKAVVQSTVRRILQAQADKSSAEQVLAWAPTQSGKSAYKAVEIATFLTMRIHVILVTKGKKECQELAEKLKYYFHGSSFQNQILCVSDNPDGKSIVAHFRQRKSKLGSVLVSLDSYQKIRLLRKALESVKSSWKKKARRLDFALQVDEVDAIMGRSKDESERNEKETKKLRAMRPIAETLVTATPMPTMFKFLLDPSQQKKFPKVFHIEPKRDYVGVDCHRILKMNGEEVFLDSTSMSNVHCEFESKFTDKTRKVEGLFTRDKPDKLAPAAKFPLKPKHKHIPSWNEQCHQMFDSFFQDRDNGKSGLLMLVATCPRTEQKGNIFEQATFLQDLYFAEDNSFVAIIAHADKIFYRLPGHRFGFEVSARRCIGEVIQAIDKDKRFGLGMPIVVFGYHKLNRSISYRSDGRVPTHMIMYHREGQSNETVRQAAGRGTFVGREVLVKNTQSGHVKDLMTREDCQLVQMHDPLVKKICDFAEEGKSWDEISQLLRPDENYLMQSNRKTGVYDMLKLYNEGKHTRSAACEEPEPKRAKMDKNVANGEGSTGEGESTLADV